MELFESQRKKVIFALLYFSNSYLFKTRAAYPAGHFELVEVPYRRYKRVFTVTGIEDVTVTANRSFGSDSRERR